MLHFACNWAATECSCKAVECLNYFVIFLTLINFDSGSGIFGSANPAAYARAIVEATTHYNNPLKVAEASTGLGAGMKGENDLNRAGLTSKIDRIRI